MEDKYYFALQWKGNSTLSNHGIFATEEEAFQSIRMWWDLNDFSPEYVRTWRKDDRMVIDYGFHHSFYYIIKINKDNFGAVLYPVNNKSKNRSFDKLTEKELEDEIEEFIGDISGQLWKDVSLNPNFYLH